VVVEEYLDGPELSLFVLTDGLTVRPMLPAQDFKRLEDADAGPNTGGMGAYAPLPWLPPGTVSTVMRQIVTPTLDHLRSLGTPFTGLLYVGLALTVRGPRVVEFNARFGDPETEVLLPLLEQPLGQLLYAAATGALADQPELSFADEACVGVVMAAAGYPDHPRRGARIGLPPDTDTVHVIHAGTSQQDGQLVAAGGRVLVVVGRGTDLAQARGRVYQHIEQIRFSDGVYRHDIAAPERLAAHAAAAARWLPAEDR
jgi:phosphoribosylamine--glycine ligase